MTTAPASWPAEWCDWLAREMLAQGWSTRTLEARSGVDHTTISRLRRGHCEPTLFVAVVLSRALGAEALDLR